MKIISQISRGAWLLGMLAVTLLIVPAARAQDSFDQILYAVNGSDNTAIYTLNLDGDTQSGIGSIHNFGSDAGWSPDGKTIYLYDFDGTSQRTMTLIDVDTNQRRTLPDQLDGDRCTLPFWWSPDGKLLAYAAKTDTQAVLKIIDTSSGDLQPLTNASLLYGEVSWSHDGRYLAYRVESESPDKQYGFAFWDVQDKRTVLTIEIASLADPPLWSPSENRVVYASPDSSQDIVYNFADGTQQHYSAGRIGRWSPDGRFLTIYTPDADGNKAISVIDVVAHNTLELDRNISTADVDFDSAWSFDGHYLALATIDHANAYKRTIYVVDMTDQSSRSLIADPAFYNSFVWSPVDNTLGFATYPESGDGGTPYTALWVFDLKGQDHQRFDVEIAPYYYQPALNWSSDGRYLTVKTTSGLSLFDKESAQLSPIARSIQKVPRTYWSPDGSRIALPSLASTSNDIYVFTPESSTLKNVTHTPDESETFLGWRGTKHNQSLIFCGEG